mmetsp:Transcript_26589/g.79469  ORF Transcript_26589/g.79469 Transcript_26589/m.79469 type:complete len:203 (-) Transcript_26589:74-682(-)
MAALVSLRACRSRQTGQSAAQRPTAGPTRWSWARWRRVRRWPAPAAQSSAGRPLSSLALPRRLCLRAVAFQSRCGRVRCLHVSRRSRAARRSRTRPFWRVAAAAAAAANRRTRRASSSACARTLRAAGSTPSRWTGVRSLCSSPTTTAAARARRTASSTRGRRARIFDPGEAALPAEHWCWCCGVLSPCRERLFLVSARGHA